MVILEDLNNLLRCKKKINIWHQYLLANECKPNSSQGHFVEVFVFDQLSQVEIFLLFSENSYSLVYQYKLSPWPG